MRWEDLMKIKMLLLRQQKKVLAGPIRIGNNFIKSSHKNGIKLARKRYRGSLKCGIETRKKTV
jgi:hypothetical protein